MTQSSIRFRVQKIMKHHNLTQFEFSRMTGISREKVASILSGRIKANYDFIYSVLKNFTDINANWFVMEQGEMLK